MQSQREQQGVPVRPAVYTQEKVGVRERMRIARRWGTGTQVAMWQIVLAAVLIGVLVVLAVSGPLHDCYTAWRDSGRLEVEYGVVSSINEELDQDIQELHTEEGVQDEARRLGYVMPDEEALIVKNLEEATPAEAEQVQTALDKYEQGLPWYVHVLDDVMGYKVK